MNPRVRCALPQLLTAGVLASCLLLAALVHNSDAGPVPGPPQVVLTGLALGLHPEASRRFELEYPPRLGPLQELGARALLLPVPVMQHDLHSHDLRAGAATPSDAVLRAVVREAHRRGMATVLMPLLILETGPSEDWRGRIQPDDPVAWWRAYGALVAGYAELAAEEHVAVFVMGSELSSMSQSAEPWRQLAAALRRVYPGRLAVVANHDALDLLAPFEAADLAGVSAYFPLSEHPEASQEDLRKAWAQINARLRAFEAAAHRPLVIFELGYASIDGAAVRPWDSLGGGPVDLEEQRRAYVAATEAMLALRPHGVFFWTWFGPGGPLDRHYTPRGKPAEAVLRRFLSRGSGG